jgi:hypothetical protein
MSEDKKTPCLPESQLDSLRVKYGKIGVVTYNHHTIVFKRPNRDHIREYRRKRDTPAERADAMDQLAQITIIAFDLIDDPNKARIQFTDTFLEEYPIAISHPKFLNVLTALAGLVEEEDYQDLGEGASVRSAPPSTSQTA